jgi:hypothetical protein
MVRKLAEYLATIWWWFLALKGKIRCFLNGKRLLFTIINYKDRRKKGLWTN